ncbi:MAG: ATP-binding protein [Sphingomonas sp.]|uniref:ATP-binding protein n=1 Tax=Sphingomonas sp. TaxID=28214 RepID=UPI001AC6F0D9|nr:ATP-binding protein [Sphingomonas sp.]MBN8809349.1 ATP-binding protein [Sphingomonas sp.]
MTAKIDMGCDASGRTIDLDLEELLATRLLVQGNSGSGKSHLLRRLLEGSAGLVQQVVIDPEGDFVSLADAFDHIAIDAADYTLPEVARLGVRAREHRASVVLNLEGLEIDSQMRCAATFLAALFDAPREQWYPVLVVVDEAQLFAPAAAGEVTEEARKASLSAMTNLMCRGRKRGLAGVIATQRLAKLAKNVAAEASNFLMGRTFLDIDMARAADLLGMERRQADAIRDLERGEFLALGPAISRRPVSVRIGAVATSAKNAGPKLTPLPSGDAADLRSALFAARPEETPPPPPPPPPPVVDILASIEASRPTAVPAMPVIEEDAQEDIRRAVVAAIVAEDTRLPLAQLYQDYQVRCRSHGVTALESLADFRRRLAMAQGGLSPDEDWDDTMALAAALPDEMWAPFLGIARAARHTEPCPDDERLAALYGTSSPSRARRMLGFIEERGLIVVRVDMLGKRSIALPHFGWTTAPAAAQPTRDLPRSARSRAMAG